MGFRNGFDVIMFVRMNYLGIKECKCLISFKNDLDV